MGKKDEFSNLDLLTTYNNQLSNKKEIPLSNIYPNPEQPRVFGKENVEDLLPSMKSDGLIEPIVLRKKSKDHYIIIAGERRFQTAKKLNWETIPAVILNVNEDKAFEMSLVENEKRKNLNPWEVGRAIIYIREKQNKTVREVAEVFGYTERYIKKLSAIARLEKEEIKKMIEEKVELSVTNLSNRIKGGGNSVKKSGKDDKIILNIKNLKSKEKEKFFQDLDKLKRKYNL